MKQEVFVLVKEEHNVIVILGLPTLLALANIDRLAVLVFQELVLQLARAMTTRILVTVKQELPLPPVPAMPGRDHAPVK